MEDVDEEADFGLHGLFQQTDEVSEAETETVAETALVTSTASMILNVLSGIVYFAFYFILVRVSPFAMQKNCSRVWEKRRFAQEMGFLRSTVRLFS